MSWAELDSLPFKMSKVASFFRWSGKKPSCKCSWYNLERHCSPTAKRCTASWLSEAPDRDSRGRVLATLPSGDVKKGRSWARQTMSSLSYDGRTRALLSDFWSTSAITAKVFSRNIVSASWFLTTLRHTSPSGSPQTHTLHVLLYSSKNASKDWWQSGRPNLNETSIYIYTHTHTHKWYRRCTRMYTTHSTKIAQELWMVKLVHWKKKKESDVKKIKPAATNA